MKIRKLATIAIAALLLFPLAPKASAITAIPSINPSISTGNLEDAAYLLGDEAKALSVGLLAIGETVQWQYFDSSADDAEWTDIPGATSAAYLPPTDTQSYFKYRAAITKNETTEYSEEARICTLVVPELKLTPAEQEIFVGQPAATIYCGTKVGSYAVGYYKYWRIADSKWFYGPTPNIEDARANLRTENNFPLTSFFIDSAGTTYFWRQVVFQDPINGSIEIEVTTDPAKLTVAYTNPFTDISDTDWFYEDVLNARNLGLFSGMSPTTFSPGGNLTIAQAIKLAACMHQYHNAGNVTLVNGTGNWYDSYVDYAAANGIISPSAYVGRYNDYATRAQYVEIFFYALPESWYFVPETENGYFQTYPIKHLVPSGAIPDVSINNTYGYEVYTFYRTGILQGNDALGTFAPDSNIKRSEVAVIINRMIDPWARIFEAYEWEN